MTLLLLDEDTDFRNALSSILKSRGLQVTEAGSGIDGLSHLRQKKFDVVLCDVPTPVSDVKPFLSTAIKMSADTPLFILTSSTPYSTDELLSMGAAGYFEKGAVKISDLILRLQGF